MLKKVIVAGGAGYIGSHVAVELLQAGRDVLILDNFCNSHPESIKRIAELAPGNLEFFQCDLSDHNQADAIAKRVQAFGADSAIHLAGLKAVGESVEKPALYYQVNIDATLNLVKAMEAADAKAIVFSSSATVYGDHNENPVTEEGRTGPTNPYGRTKLFIEDILTDIAVADQAWRVVNLRYFNPVGAHPSGRIGEDPNGIPNNLFPFIAQVAVGRRKQLSIFGNDYDTRDGTGVRDYIHVTDLARGHVAALDFLSTDKSQGATKVNLGTGVGYSVLESVAAFKRASNRDIPYEIAPRRDGDIAEIYANADRAKELLGWVAEKSIDDMCADHWRWQSNNPNGFSDAE